MARKLNQRLRELDKGSNASSRSKGGGAPPPFGRDANPEPPVELAAFVMFAFFGTILLVALAVLFGLRDVQEDVERRALNAVRSTGITEVEANVTGFEVSIVGSSEDQDLIELAEARVRSLSNMEVVNFNVVYLEPRVPVETVVTTDPFVLQWAQFSTTASGTFSTQQRLDQVIAELNDVFGSVDVSGLGVTEGAPDEDWLSTVLTLIRKMRQEALEGEIVVNPTANLIQVSAEFDTRQKQRDVRDDVEEILQNVTLQFSSGITAKDVPRVTIEEVIETQTTLDEIIEGKVVEFEFASAELTDEGKALLDDLLEGLRENPLVGVEIGGHTDDIGDELENLALSEARALAVVDYFVARGEDRERFVVVGYGESQPIASNDTDEGRARNRRIEFTALLDEEEEE